MNNAPVPLPPLMSPVLSSKCSSNQEIYVFNPLTKFMERQEDFNRELSASVGTLRETGNRLKIKLTSIEGQIQREFAKLGQLYVQHEGFIQRELTKISNLYKQQENYIQKGFMKLKEQNKKQEQFLYENVGKLHGELQKMDGRLNSIQQEDKISREITQQQLNLLSEQVASILQQVRRQNNILEKNEEQLDDLFIYVLFSLYHLQEITNSLENLEQKETEYHLKLNQFMEDLRVANQEVLEVLNQLLQTKGALKVLLKTLPPNYPLSGITIEGQMITVDRFVYLNKKTNIVYFLQGTSMITVDVNKLSSIHFKST